MISFKSAAVLGGFVAGMTLLFCLGHIPPVIAIVMTLAVLVISFPIAYACDQDDAQRRLIREILAAQPNDVTLWVEYESYFDSWDGYQVENRAALYVKLNGTASMRLARAWNEAALSPSAQRVQLGYGTVLAHDLVKKFNKAGFSVRDPLAAISTASSPFWRTYR